MKPTLVIIGLGNPGTSYERTRHNAGFMGVDTLSEEFGVGEWQERQKFNATVQEARIVTVPVLLVKPKTYMNRSGETVRKVVDFFKLNAAEQLLVLTDDIDLPLGTLRLRKSGGPGTHNGLRSIVEHIGEGFARLRVGIGPGPRGLDLAAWVVSAFSPEEQKIVEETLKKIPEQVRAFVLDGAKEAD